MFDGVSSGANEPIHRRELWEKMKAPTPTMEDELWILMGDLTPVRAMDNLSRTQALWRSFESALRLWDSMLSL
ncbi:UNVERIFIED_CONTAM: hypothetical protein Sangu_2409900 [Sesamum angustifolium]|uniref:Uncharacterized protein n=1 Tax=Sesamum angustifolium TaxID=2727405 RepID=A0AAW2KYL2_9LAMI